jgi:hypothetical protein
MPPEDSLDNLRDEVVRLRDWRHDEATPLMLANREQGKYIAAQLQSIDERLDKFEHRLDEMARADDIADAIQEHSRGFRRGFLNAWERGLIVAAAVVGAVGVVLQLWH